MCLEQVTKIIHFILTSQLGKHFFFFFWFNFVENLLSTNSVFPSLIFSIFKCENARHFKVVAAVEKIIKRHESNHENYRNRKT